MKKSVLLIQLCIFVIIFIWSAIHPVKRSIWFYEVIPAVLLIIILLLTYHRFPLTPLSYWIIFIGTILMLIGGHYTYGGVPLFTTFKQMFHLKRNDFDRFGHVFFGMIFAALLREYFVRTHVMRKEKGLFVIIGMLSVSMSALYEIFEFGIGKLFDGNIQNFLGYQGDIFDSHWDMISALIGSVLVLALGKIQDKQMMMLPKKKTALKMTSKLHPNE